MWLVVIVENMTVILIENFDDSAFDAVSSKFY